MATLLYQSPFKYNVSVFYIILGEHGCMILQCALILEDDDDPNKNKEAVKKKKAWHSNKLDKYAEKYSKQPQCMY